MNYTAEKLTGYKEREAAGKHLDEIFRIINEKTRSKVESPVNKVLREGMIGGLANHTILITKEGKEIPIADSGAPVTDLNNELTGVVLVFRDQSKERAAQNDLFESAMQLKHSRRVARIGYYIYDIKNGTWESSEILDKLFGIDQDYRKDITGWLEIIHPEHKKVMQDYLDINVLENKEDFNKEYRIINKKDNKIYWVYGPGNLEFDKNGEPVKMFGTIQDITQRKNDEEILLYQKSFLQQMGKMAKVGGWEFDPVTGKGIWTEEIALIHDLNPNEEISLAKGLGFYSVDSRIKIEKAINDAVESGKPYDLELELVNAKGIHKWVRTIGKPSSENGKNMKILGSFQDITETKVAELSLRESEEKFRNIVETANEGIMIADSEGVISFVNCALAKMLGYIQSEIIGKDIIELISSSEAEDFKLKMSERERGVHDIFERKYKRKDGDGFNRIGFRCFIV